MTFSNIIHSGKYTKASFLSWEWVTSLLFHRWQATVSDLTVQVMGGFLFGAESNSRKLEEAMKTLGVSHLFAASGANISLVLLLTQKLLPKAQKSRFFSRVVVILGYWFLAGGGASLGRAAIMAILGFFSRDMMGRRVSQLRIFGLCLLCVAAVTPVWFSTLSFQLSAAATFALVLSGGLQQRPFGFFTPLPNMAMWTKSRNWWREQVTTSWWAAIGTWPIIGVHFGEVNGAGIISSAFASSVVELLTVMASLLLFFDIFSSFFSPLISILIECMYSLFVYVVFWFADWPYLQYGVFAHTWTTWQVRVWSVFWVGCWWGVRYWRDQRDVNNWRSWHAQ